MGNNLYIGDIHGNIDVINQLITSDNIGNYLIQVGDFGVDVQGKELRSVFLNAIKMLNYKLSKCSMKLFIVRGNHDNPFWFDNKHYYSNIVFVKDYSVININGLNHLFIGGGISINRKQKRFNNLYFKDESFIYNEDIINQLKNIDIVVSHIAPNYCFPLMIGNIVFKFAEHDMHLIDDINLERNNFTKMAKILLKNNNITNWYYGHYHKSKTEIIDNCRYKLLNINEVEMLKPCNS